MFKSLLIATAAATILAFSATAAIAQNELDHEKAYSNFTADPLKGTVILRVDKKTGKLDGVYSADHFVKSNEDARTTALKGQFAAIDKSKVSSELDNTKGVSSWYFVAGGSYYGGYHGYYGGYYGAYYGYHPYYYGGYYNYYPAYYPTYYYYGTPYVPCYGYNYGAYNYYYYQPTAWYY